MGGAQSTQVGVEEEEGSHSQGSLWKQEKTQINKFSSESPKQYTASSPVKPVLNL
jgi:hypothetical protein